MSRTLALSVEMSTGYAGKLSQKSYIARLTGTDKKYIFARDFLATDADDKNAMFRARTKGRGSWIERAVVEPGLYEIQEHGERRYVIVWLDGDEVKSTSTNVERAIRLAVLLDAGGAFDDARRASKQPKGQ